MYSVESIVYSVQCIMYSVPYLEAVLDAVGQQDGDQGEDDSAQEGHGGP